jgi:hypothetical protein
MSGFASPGLGEAPLNILPAREASRDSLGRNDFAVMIAPEPLPSDARSKVGSQL